MRRQIVDPSAPLVCCYTLTVLFVQDFGIILPNQTRLSSMNMFGPMMMNGNMMGFPGPGGRGGLNDVFGGPLGMLGMSTENHPGRQKQGVSSVWNVTVMLLAPVAVYKIGDFLNCLRCALLNCNERVCGSRWWGDWYRTWCYTDGRLHSRLFQQHGTTCAQHEHDDASQSK